MPAMFSGAAAGILLLVVASPRVPQRAERYRRSRLLAPSAAAVDSVFGLLSEERIGALLVVCRWSR